jgi:hypothetical protein
MIEVGPPQVELDPNEHIFVGRVMGYAGPYTSTNVVGEFAGIRVGVLEAIYVPRNREAFDVFMFALAADCTTVGASLYDLRFQYPIGTEVMIAAWPAAGFNSTEDTHSLEVSWRHGALEITTIPAAELASRQVDYAWAFGLGRREFEQEGFGTSLAVMRFEVQKEFARLRNASRARRIEILRRLKGNPFVDYEYIVRHQLPWSPTGRRFIREWKDAEARRKAAPN